MEMIIAFFFGVVTMIACNILRKPEVKSQWKLLHYIPYYDTSFGKRLASCRFTVVDEKSQEVYNRICYGKMYSQGEILHAMKLGVAHKLGEKDNLN